MSIVAVKVLSTVNAPYGTTLSAEQLASKISDPASAVSFDPSAFSFFSEVDESLQISFLDEMHVDPMAASDLRGSSRHLLAIPSLWRGRRSWSKTRSADGATCLNRLAASSKKQTPNLL